VKNLENYWDNFIIADFTFFRTAGSEIKFLNADGVLLIRGLPDQRKGSRFHIRVVAAFVRQIISKYRLDAVMRVTSDCLLADGNLIRDSADLIEQYEAHRLNHAEIIKLLQAHPELVKINANIEQKKI